MLASNKEEEEDSGWVSAHHVFGEEFALEAHVDPQPEPEREKTRRCYRSKPTGPKKTIEAMALFRPVTRL